MSWRKIWIFLLEIANSTMGEEMAKIYSGEGWKLFPPWSFFYRSTIQLVIKQFFFRVIFLEDDDVAACKQGVLSIHRYRLFPIKNVRHKMLNIFKDAFSSFEIAKWMTWLEKCWYVFEDSNCYPFPLQSTY